MKRMEELIHLNKKIHFEGKVREAFEGSSYYHIFVFFFCSLKQSLLPFFVDLSSYFPVTLAGKARRTPGSRHSDNEHLWIKAQVTHQASVPPPVQWLPAAVQEEGVSYIQCAHKEKLKYYSNDA